MNDGCIWQWMPPPQSPPLLSRVIIILTHRNITLNKGNCRLMEFYLLCFVIYPKRRKICYTGHIYFICRCIVLQLSVTATLLQQWILTFWPCEAVMCHQHIKKMALNYHCHGILKVKNSSAMVISAQFLHSFRHSVIIKVSPMNLCRTYTLITTPNAVLKPFNKEHPNTYN